MANTIKTMQGEILVSEVEAITLDNNIYQMAKMPAMTAKVVVVGKSGIKYDLTTSIKAIDAMKIYTAAINYVAGTGHTVFDPTQVK